MEDWHSPERWRVLAPHLDRALDLSDEVQQALDHLRPSVGPDAPSTRRAFSELARLTSTLPGPR